MARRAGVAVALALAVLGGCGSEAEPGADATLRVYVSAPLTGPARAEGRELVRGARQAFRESGGEAGGYRVEPVFLDVAGRNETRFDAVTAAANGRRAAEDSTTIAYIGELYSGATRSSLPITNAAGILQVAPGSGAADLVRDGAGEDVPEAVQNTGERTYAQLVPTYEAGERPAPRDPYELGYEAMASVLAAIDRAGDPAARDSVVSAYFDGTRRESGLGVYEITATGELAR